MSKRKKTRQEKIITGLRRKLSINGPDRSLDNQALAYTSMQFQPIKTAQYEDLITYNTMHFKKDIQKTAIITFGILAFEIILFLLIKNQLISFSIIGL
ncbi:hypothetical protein LBMAG33_0640 [Candidatus Levyibacteriota bacterium]|nr:hypothetical protein [Candidatus Levybacteria bacterium]MSU25640.1 hypothetical protein [Candidatus Levybacteria bacterium]GDX61754.1 hypothetical protein LBMAG33_0640 [Candidatus Levybacteria bacterium]